MITKLSKCVDDHIHANKDLIREVLINEIKSYNIDCDCTVSEFLAMHDGGIDTDGELSPYPTTYSHSISYAIHGIAVNMMHEALSKCLKNEMSEEEIEEIINDLYDDIYMESIAHEFFVTDYAAWFTGIDDIKISDL